MCIVSRCCRRLSTYVGPDSCSTRLRLDAHRVPWCALPARRCGHQWPLELIALIALALTGGPHLAVCRLPALALLARPRAHAPARACHSIATGAARRQPRRTHGAGAASTTGVSHYVWRRCLRTFVTKFIVFRLSSSWIQHSARYVSM